MTTSRLPSQDAVNVEGTPSIKHDENFSPVRLICITFVFHTISDIITSQLLQSLQSPQSCNMQHPEEYEMDARRPWDQGNSLTTPITAPQAQTQPVNGAQDNANSFPAVTTVATPGQTQTDGGDDEPEDQRQSTDHDQPGHSGNRDDGDIEEQQAKPRLMGFWRKEYDKKDDIILFGSKNPILPIKVTKLTKTVSQNFLCIQSGGSCSVFSQLLP